MQLIFFIKKESAQGLIQFVDKVDGMQTVENFERQGAAESRLRSVFIIRDLSETKPATQYFVVCLQSKSAQGLILANNLI